jgi:hypothetical protein
MEVIMYFWAGHMDAAHRGISHNITSGYHVLDALLLSGSHALSSEDFTFNWNVNFIKLTKLLFFKKKVIIFQFCNNQTTM